MPERLERIVLVACVAAALGHAALYLGLSVQRIAYPFELEWMEGGSLEHMLRVLRGEPLYVAASIDFVPFPYPPFYYYLGALLSQITGPGFVPLRLVSLLASLGTAWIVYRTVRRDADRVALGVVAAGIFLGTWRASGLYFDVARLDSLFAFLLLASLYRLRFARGRADLAAAAALSFLAVMTKQTAAVAVAPVVLWCAWADWNAAGRDVTRFREWSRFPWYGLLLAALVGAAALLLEGLDGHFLRYVLGVQQQHAIVPRMIGFFLWQDLLLVLPVCSAAVVAWAALGRSRWREEDAFHLAALAGVTLACVIPRIKQGGAANNLIPIHAFLVAMLGVSIARLRARTPPGRVAAVSATVAACLLLQLLVLVRPPRGYVPSDADRRAGRALEAWVADARGEVLMPVQGYLAGRAGKRVYAHQLPVQDYARSGLADAADLRDSYVRAIREQRFAAVVDSNTAFLRGYLPEGLLERYYERERWLFEDVGVLLPISGARIRSGTWWVPRPAHQLERR